MLVCVGFSVSSESSRLHVRHTHCCMRLNAPPAPRALPGARVVGDKLKYPRLRTTVTNEGPVGDGGTRCRGLTGHAPSPQPPTYGALTRSRTGATP